MVDVPFFRLSPQLSENIPLDCTDDRTLINMLWETQCYIYQHWERIQQLAILLKSWSVQDKIPKIKNPGACFSKVRSHYWSKVNFKKANKWVSIISITHSRKKRGNINDFTACQRVCLSFQRGGGDMWPKLMILLDFMFIEWERILRKGKTTIANSNRKNNEMRDT